MTAVNVEGAEVAPEESPLRYILIQFNPEEDNPDEASIDITAEGLNGDRESMIALLQAVVDKLRTSDVPEPALV